MRKIVIADNPQGTQGREKLIFGHCHPIDKYHILEQGRIGIDETNHKIQPVQAAISPIVSFEHICGPEQNNQHRHYESFIVVDTSGQTNRVLPKPGYTMFGASRQNFPKRTTIYSTKSPLEIMRGGDSRTYVRIHGKSAHHRTQRGKLYGYGYIGQPIQQIKIQVCHDNDYIHSIGPNYKDSGNTRNHIIEKRHVFECNQYHHRHHKDVMATAELNEGNYIRNKNYSPGGPKSNNPNWRNIQDIIIYRNFCHYEDLIHEPERHDPVNSIQPIAEILNED